MIRRLISSASAILAACVAALLAATQEVFAHGIGGFAIQNPVVRRLVLGALFTGVVILLLYHADAWARERVHAGAPQGAADSGDAAGSHGELKPR